MATRFQRLRETLKAMDHKAAIARRLEEVIARRGLLVECNKELPNSSLFEQIAVCDDEIAEMKISLKKRASADTDETVN